MISQSAEYALRAVVWLAGHPESTLSTPEIARPTMVPAGYLSKVLQALARNGLVVSTPGRAGGFVLNRPANRNSVISNSAEFERTGTRTMAAAVRKMRLAFDMKIAPFSLTHPGIRQRAAREPRSYDVQSRAGSRRGPSRWPGGPGRSDAQTGSGSAAGETRRSVPGRGNPEPF